MHTFMYMKCYNADEMCEQHILMKWLPRLGQIIGDSQYFMTYTCCVCVCALISMFAWMMRKHSKNSPFCDSTVGEKCDFLHSDYRFFEKEYNNRKQDFLQI